MVSDLKLDLFMMRLEQGPNFKLVGNSAVNEEEPMIISVDASCMEFFID